MAKLITLAEDGPLGKAGEQVWVNDSEEQADKPAKKSAAKKSAAKSSK